MTADTDVTGVEERFTALAAGAGPRLLAYLARRVDPPADAADVLAEVLATAWRRRADLPGDDDQAVAWLFGVARRTLANHRRAQTRRTALADRLRDHLATAFGRYEPAPDEVVDVRAALASLSEDDRELLVLTAWDGLTPAEAAQLLGLSAATARKRLQRARQRLREHLADQVTDGPRRLTAVPDERARM